MKNLKSILNQPLSWKFEKRKITLSSNKEIVVGLNEEKSTKATFAFDGKDYIIRNEGF